MQKDAWFSKKGNKKRAINVAAHIEWISARICHRHPIPVSSPGGRLHLIGFHNSSRSKQGPSATTGGSWSFGARIAGFARVGVTCHDEIAGLTPPPSKPKKSRTGPRVSKSRETPQVSPAMQVW